MAEEHIDVVPNAFKAVDADIAASVGKNVYGYQQEQKVLKVIKGGARENYPSSQEAIQAIKENEAQRQRVREILQQLGSMGETIPHTSSVDYISIRLINLAMLGKQTSAGETKASLQPTRQ